VATLDVLAALAETAAVNNYTKPHVHEGDEMIVTDARHPVVERRTASAGEPEILGPDRPVVIARELTKIHEEFLRGTAQEILGILKQRGEVKGEIVLLIGAAAEGAGQIATISIRTRVEQIMQEEKVDEKTALKKVARELGISKSEAYRQLQNT
jgi:16S rRNA (cytidine1402-2'-O)-methyltransferase